MEKYGPNTRDAIRTIARDVRNKFSWAISPQGFEYWTSVVNNLNELADPVVLEGDELAVLYHSPGLKEGYDTVVGYLAKNDPDRLTSDPADTVKDGCWLTSASRNRGLDVIKVSVPHVFEGRNMAFVNSYPETLIRERFDHVKACHAGPGSGRHRYTKRNQCGR